MRTPKQQEAARENGRKSRGPITIHGKLESRYNAVNHGLNGGPVVLNGENAAIFEKLRQAYEDRFRPADQVEADLVFELCAIRWRQRRLWSMETAALDLEIDRQRPDIDREFSHIDEPTRQASAYKTLSDKSNTAANYARNDAFLRRNYDRTFANLLAVQSTRPEKQYEPGKTKSVFVDEQDPGSAEPERAA